jgi:hypothetical protein
MVDENMAATDRVSESAPEPQAAPVPTEPQFGLGDVVILKGHEDLPLTVEGKFNHPDNPSVWFFAVAWFDINDHLQRAQFSPEVFDLQRRAGSSDE